MQPWKVFFHSLKVELFTEIPIPSVRIARQSISEYNEVYYNRQCRHSAAGYQIPLLYDDDYEERA